ncbi:hypothetical protein EST38_g5853 [Candolleomyces aberdarensis]|uniref:Nephrocystin 3-like N-terminal domain-containing protein n=1 Tax=Candolleomyces aberdarensis TaxID=2316362 RepID=A0A4Q2DLA7_9AGAR|nr:hypothetical protein EST38_g5853 [Candolleomyces aberdarensis]
MAIPRVAPFVRAALDADQGLLAPEVSLEVQLERLVFDPFNAIFSETPDIPPYLIVIDGLDECEDREDVRLFLETTLNYFQSNPLLPLRFFIASRIEQHIKDLLEVDEVTLDDLVSRGSDHDIETFIRKSFEDAARRNRVIREYIRHHGGWPLPNDLRVLSEHI